MITDLFSILTHLMHKHYIKLGINQRTKVARFISTLHKYNLINQPKQNILLSFFKILLNKCSQICNLQANQFHELAQLIFCLYGCGGHFLCLFLFSKQAYNFYRQYFYIKQGDSIKLINDSIYNINQQVLTIYPQPMHGIHHTKMASYQSKILPQIQQMQSFIQFKVENKQRSQSQARVYTLKIKYQKLLNKCLKEVNYKNKQLKSFQYEAKRMKKMVWNELLLISNSVQTLEKERYEYIDEMRRIKDERQNAKITIQQNKIHIKQEQEQLRVQIKQSIEHSQYYHHQKIETIKQIKLMSEQIQKRILQIMPAIQQVQAKKQNQGKLLQRVNQLRQRSRQKVKQIWSCHQTLDQLNKKTKESFLKKQQAENLQTQNKRKQILQLITSLNNNLSTDSYEQSNKITISSLIKQAKEKLDSYTVLQETDPNLKLINDNKIKQVGQKLINQKKSKPILQLYIKQGIGTKSETRIKQLSKDIQKQRKQEQILIKRQNSLIQQESSIDKQITKLKQTLQKINKNLGTP